MTRRSSVFAALLLAAGVVAIPEAARAHAALIEAETVQAIRLHAQYDTGEPMVEAQVIIYAADSPTRVWGLGLTDAAGVYTFVPDDTEGRWTIQVRQAGHGATAHVELAQDAVPVLTASAGAAGQGWPQRALMVALVAWGALGTALFVLRNRKRDNASA